MTVWNGLLHPAPRTMVVVVKVNLSLDMGLRWLSPPRRLQTPVDRPCAYRGSLEFDLPVNSRKKSVGGTRKKDIRVLFGSAARSHSCFEKKKGRGGPEWRAKKRRDGAQKGARMAGEKEPV